MLQIEESKKEAWDKFYSVYMFDEIKYHKLCKEKPTENKTLLKRQCYVLDDDGKRIHLGDEKHIFRANILRNVQTELAEYCRELRGQLNMFEKNCSDSIVTQFYTLYYERFDKGTYLYGRPKNKVNANNSMGTGQLGLFSFLEKPSNEFEIKIPWDSFEVELNNTWQLPLGQRVLLHLKTLRLCRQGYSLTEAAKTVLNKATM